MTTQIKIRLTDPLGLCKKDFDSTPAQAPSAPPSQPPVNPAMPIGWPPVIGGPAVSPVSNDPSWPLTTKGTSDTDYPFIGDPPGHWGSSSITQTPKIDWESLPYHPAGWLTKMDSAYQDQAKSHDAGVNLTSFMNQG